MYSRYNSKEKLKKLEKDDTSKALRSLKAVYKNRVDKNQKDKVCVKNSCSNYFIDLDQNNVLKYRVY